MGILDDIFGGGQVDEDELDPDDMYAQPPSAAEAAAEKAAQQDWFDTDKDGVDDATEIKRGLDPELPDTDGDGALDGEELVHTGYTASVTGRGDEWLVGNLEFTYDTRSNALVQDTDRDGLLDGEEFTAKSDPFVMDTDGDKLLDGDEVHLHHTDPTLRDTDGNQGDDFTEIQNGTNPLGSLTEAEQQQVADKVANSDSVLDHLRQSSTPAAHPEPNALRALTNAGVDVSNVGSAPPPPPAEPGPNALRALTNAGVDTSNIGSTPQVAEPSPLVDQPPAPAPDDLDFGGGSDQPGAMLVNGDYGQHPDIEQLATHALSHADSAGNGQPDAAEDDTFVPDDGADDRGGDDEPSGDDYASDDADAAAM